MQCPFNDYMKLRHTCIYIYIYQLNRSIYKTYLNIYLVYAASTTDTTYTPEINIVYIQSIWDKYIYKKYIYISPLPSTTKDLCASQSRASLLTTAAIFPSIWKSSLPNDFQFSIHVMLASSSSLSYTIIAFHLIDLYKLKWNSSQRYLWKPYLQ